MCELGLAEDFYRRGKDVPYILIKVDPKPRKAGRHNSKPRRKKERQKLRLDFTLFPQGISLNGTLVPPVCFISFFRQELLLCSCEQKELLLAVAFHIIDSLMMVRA